MQMEFHATTHGNYRFDFPRITVVLGANGSGKSTLLRKIKDAHQSIYVEGGRTIKIDDVVKLTRQNFNDYQNLNQTLIKYKQKRRNKLVDRIFDAIMLLIQKEQVLKDAHSDAVVLWEKGGRVGDIPKRGQPPLEKLFEQYNEIFPHINITYNKSDGRVTVVNDNTPDAYGPSSLSDGEKQVFSLMTDMLEIEDEYNVVVVDEPELNLHPELAERLWALLESEYPDKHFIYATHSIQFALRSNVDALYVISSDPTKIRKIENLAEMPRSDLERFLGGVPGILNAGKVVVTEGHEKSFDSIFYRWLLNDGTVEIFPCGNCNDVRQVIGKRGLWSQVSSDIVLTGVVDPDYRSSASNARSTADHIVQLSLHEAESYLCIPDLLVAAASAIASQEVNLTEKEVKDCIFHELRSKRISIALKRSFANAGVTVRLSLEKSTLAAISTKDEAMNLIKDISAGEINKAVEAMDESAFEARLDSELAHIDQIISSGDVIAALRLVPGKELLAKLAPRAGCKNGVDLMRSVKSNLSLEQFSVVKSLANEIRASIAHQEASRRTPN
jgi:ABC-type lipoprotein export system ATPase subunit